MVQRLLEPGEIESLDHTTIARLLLPQPHSVFTARAARLRQLAQGEVTGIPVGATLRGYLLLMAALVDAQTAVTAALPPDAVTLPDTEAMARADQHHMPLIPISGERSPVWRSIFAGLLDHLETLAASQPASAQLPPQLPPQFSRLLAELRALDAATLEACADAVLAQQGEDINPLHAPFVAAALQVLWTVQAGRLAAIRAPTLETGVLCPVCGSHPVASVIRIGGQSQGYRYLQCGICSSQWHMVRVKCSTCESNSQIAYQGLDLADADAFDAAKPVNKANDPKKVARAETCEQCHTYRKIFNQEHDYNVEPLADDLASLMLDLLVSEAGYARASGNPLLWFSDAV